jgi:hypothetical protein
MKRYLIIVFLSILSSLSVHAQVVGAYETTPEITFLPTISQTYPGLSSSVFPETSQMVSSVSTLQKATGWFLHSMKYSSVLDEFSSLAPFDLRGYKPISFSQYEIYTQQNYLLTQQSRYPLWTVR